jgi:hypothetical protein
MLRLDLLPATRPSPAGRPLTLVSVRAAPPPAGDAFVEVTLPNGIGLRVPEHADLGRVAELVRALGDGC